VNGQWLYPGDSPLVIARRVAGAYRARLAREAPDACAELDAQMVRLGQTWAVPRLLHFDLDDLLSPAQAAELAAVQPDTIGQLRRAGRLPGTLVDGVWYYLARDVLALSTHTRRRRTSGTGGAAPV
jgi:hypothetical protein